MLAGALRARTVLAGLAVMLGLAACGPQPPDATALLNQSSQHMLLLKHARVNLKEGAILLEVEVVFAADKVYLKSFTGGWQQLTDAQVGEFFDARTLFDPQTGLFAAMRDTTSATRGNKEKVAGHDTYPVAGQVSATRMHQLLTLIRDQGTYRATYWIESPGSNLWRARLTGNLFDASQAATITFDFSNHDHPVSVTPPPLG